MRWRALLVAVAAFLAGCAASKQPIAQRARPVSEPNGNFTLHVSNQSFAITPVDITIYIDDRKVVDGEFHVAGQHNWVSHVLFVEQGVHALRAGSKKGGAKMATHFTIRGKQWACVNYWYYPETSGGAPKTPRSFSFDI